MKKMNTNICKFCGITIIYPDMYKRGLCAKHYQKYLRSKELMPNYQKKVDDLKEIIEIAQQEELHFWDGVIKKIKKQLK